MRPVTRVARPAGYPTHIRVDTQQHLDADSRARWRFRNDEGGKKVAAYYGRLDPEIGEVLGDLLKLARGKRLRDEDVFNKARPTLDKRIETTYKRAATELVRSYGTFCSYCEQYLPGQLDVEHCIPKAPYPSFGVSWDNFLLGCSPCNGKSGKTDNPSRATVDSWPPTPYPNEVARYHAIRNEYVWPDTTASAYQDVRPRLEYEDPATGTWQPVADADSVQTGMTVVSQDAPSRQIQAQLSIGGAVQTVPVRVVAAHTNARGQRSVDFYRLNNFGITSNVADRRLYNRTLAWFRVVQFFAPLVDNLTTDTFDLVWPLILQAVPSVGYFSVWVRVLDLLGGNQEQVPGQPAPAQSLLHRFLHDINVPAGFPNTNLSQIP